MRAITLLLIVLLLVPHGGTLASASPLTLFGRVARFVQPLYEDAASTDIICTVFLVEHHLVSAAHCFDIDVDEGDLEGVPRYLRNGQEIHATEVYYDFAILGPAPGAILWFPERGLKLAKYHPPPSPLPNVYALGYAWGMPEIAAATGTVAGYPAKTPHFGALRLQRFHMNVIGGMSGGPVVNFDGEVVSQNMMLRTWNSSGIAFGLPLSVFQEALRR